MNPPEQAPALKQIYEARLELVRQNEVEITDLKERLDQAIRRQEKLVEQMTLAKANYQEAASKIVDLLDDNDEKEEEDGADNSKERNADKAKQSRRHNSKETERGKLKASNSSNRQEEEREHRTPSPLRPIPSNYPKKIFQNEVVDLLDSDDNSDVESSNDTKLASKRLYSSTTNSATGDVKKEDEVTQKRAKRSPRESDGKSGTSVAKTDEKKKSSTTERIQATPTNSAGKHSSDEGNSDPVRKKRSSSFTRRIKIRQRPNDIPPERWLKSSIGWTRQELNNIDDMVQYMGSCQFGQSVVVSKFGKVHAIILNDEWNVLAQRNDEYQYWYVGLGPGRKRDARLVGASQTSIPIFHAPKIEFMTKELFYVGHYKVKDIEELNPSVIEMDKERDMRVTFAFEKFDKRLNSIIEKGPDREE